jgi:putative DNA primase/helicase
MPDFVTFARDHGLILDRVIADGRVHRCRTEAKPRKRNGAYAFDGEHGFVQDWTVHDRAIPFRGDGSNIVKKPLNRAVDERRERERAKIQAREILARCEVKAHPYLQAKGLRELGLVDKEDGSLIVPMYAAERYGDITSVQRISETGEKKFLPGGRAKDAVFHLGRGDSDVLVEGYATGLTVMLALRELYRRARVVVCFSAGNLASVARYYKGRVIADNDASKAGEEAAKKSGLPWSMPSEVGMDADDLRQKEGIRAVCELLS